MTTAGFGVYVHVPFCRERCDYCAFATYTDRDHLMERYVDACVTELRAAGPGGRAVPRHQRLLRRRHPVAPGPETLCRILDAIPRAPDAEVTVECNPEDADQDHLAAYRAAGVTGCRSACSRPTPTCWRGWAAGTSPTRAERIARRCTRAGFDTWNLDLIFGGAGETDDDWRGTLDTRPGPANPPPHLSAYALTVEPGTPLAATPIAIRTRTRWPGATS